MLKSPTIIVELSISPFNSVSFCFMYFESLLLGAYRFIIVILKDWPFGIIKCTFVSGNNFYQSVSSNISIVTPALFQLACIIYLFPSFYFQPICIFNRKCVFCGQNIIGSWQFIHPTNLWFLTGMFNPFTFNVITIRWDICLLFSYFFLHLIPFLFLYYSITAFFYVK